MQNRRRAGVRTWWEFIGEMAASAASIFGATAPVQDGPRNDELGLFEAKVEKELQTLRDVQEVWRQRAIELLGSEEPSVELAAFISTTSPAAALMDPAQYSGVQLRALFTTLKKDLYELIETPAEKMKDLMDRIKPKFKQQQEHVNELIRQLHAEKDLEAQKKIKVEICKVNINLLSHFITLINEIEAKIKTSIKEDVYAEEIGISLLGATMFILAQMTFPQTDLEQETRDYMGKRIRKSAEDLDKLLVAFEGELALALRHVASDTVDSFDADAQASQVAADTSTASAVVAAAAAASASITEPETSVSALSMFAKGGTDVRAVLRTSNDAEETVTKRYTA